MMGACGGPFPTHVYFPSCRGRVTPCFNKMACCWKKDSAWLRSMPVSNPFSTMIDIKVSSTCTSQGHNEKAMTCDNDVATHESIVPLPWCNTTLTPHKPSCQIFGALLLVLCEHFEKVVGNFGTSCKDFNSENVRFLFFLPLCLDLIISQHRQNDLSQILSCQNIVSMATTTEHSFLYEPPDEKKITVHAADLSFLHDWTRTDWRARAHMTYFCETSHWNWKIIVICPL